MVSAFGSTDSPVSRGVDPTDCARRLADWAKRYDLDGVDVDWEDMNAMNTGIGEAWLITFQTELRRHLPAGQYLISHAPVAPWFTSGSNYPNGAYVAVHNQAGGGIDFYNMQFYNQGHGVYEDCQVSLSLSRPELYSRISRPVAAIRIRVKLAVDFGHGDELARGDTAS
jgi:chitinase